MRPRFRTAIKTTTPRQLMARWGRHAPLGTGEELRECAQELVDALVCERDRVRPALVRFGRQAGADGWTLGDVSSWLEALIDVGDDATRALGGFDAGTAVASGWAEGFLRGATTDGCLDPATGLATMPVLRLRLEQVSDHCESLGIEPAQLYSLVVVDLVLADVGPLRRYALLASLADELRALFTRGETLAVHENRVLVLSSRTPDLPALIGTLERRVREHDVLRHHHVLAWIEPLPADFDTLDAYLSEVAS